MLMEELLQNENFQYLKVINQKADLKREVATVESTETPDVARYLPENTLLITTAMAFKDDQMGLCELIRSLNRLPCSGLGIKLGRFIDTLDSDVIATADELGFPLLQIPSEATLGSVFHQLLAYIWNDQNTDLTLALNTQKKFSTLILKGASTKSMLNNLGLVLKKPVALIDPFGDIVETNHICIARNGETASELFHTLNLYEKQTSTVNYYQNKDGVKEQITIYPVNSIGRGAYYLFIFNSEDLSATLSTLVVEHVLLIFGFSLYKKLYVVCNAIRNREEFLEILLNKYKNERWLSRQILIMGEKYGLKSASAYQVIIGTIEPYGHNKFNFDDFSFQEERYILIYDWMSRDLKETTGGDVVLFPETGSYRYIFIIQGSCKGINQKLINYHDMFLKLLKVDMTFSFGNSMFEVDAVKYAYNEAIESYQEGEIDDEIPFIRYYRPRNASELLKTLSNDQIEGFCLHNLKLLAYPTEEMLLELRKTLRTYLDCRCSMTETANQMFLHRNTIKYRIKKCEDILEKPIEGASFCFQLQLSLVLVENK